MPCVLLPSTWSRSCCFTNMATWQVWRGLGRAGTLDVVTCVAIAVQVLLAFVLIITCTLESGLTAAHSAHWLLRPWHLYSGTSTDMG